MDAKIEIYAGRVGLETHRLILLEKKNKISMLLERVISTYRHKDTAPVHVL